MTYSKEVQELISSGDLIPSEQLKQVEALCKCGFNGTGPVQRGICSDCGEQIEPVFIISTDTPEPRDG